MVTTEEYLPTFSIEEALAVKRLVLEERHFYKPLPYDGRPTRFPNFPVPLEIVADAATRRLRMPSMRRISSATGCGMRPSTPRPHVAGARRLIAASLRWSPATENIWSDPVDHCDHHHHFENFRSSYNVTASHDPFPRWR